MQSKRSDTKRQFIPTGRGRDFPRPALASIAGRNQAATILDVQQAGAPNLRLLLTQMEAAAALAISERTLWGLTAPRGEIPAIKIGRCVRYDPKDLAAWIERQKSPASPSSGDAGSGIERTA
jgi:excisionase family DNA binding protein